MPGCRPRGSGSRPTRGGRQRRAARSAPGAPGRMSAQGWAAAADHLFMDLRSGMAAAAALIAVACAGTAWAADPDLAEKPQVSLSPATEVTMVSATLNGE